MNPQIPVDWTPEPVADRTKTVTRRKPGSYQHIQPGTVVTLTTRTGPVTDAVAYARVVSIREEPLESITVNEVEREGLLVDALEHRDQYSITGWFKHFWATRYETDPDTLCTRIEWEYL